MNPAPSHRRSELLRPASRTLATGLALALVAFSSSACQAEADLSQRPHAPRAERSLPRFEGQLLGGERGSTDLLRRKRAILYFFASTDDDVDMLVAVLGKLESAIQGANVILVGVSRDIEPAATSAFTRTHGLDGPVFLDSRGEISRLVGVGGGSSAVLVVDAEGYVVSGFQGFDPKVGTDPYEREIRKALHLEAADGSVAPAFGVRPEAPDFAIEDLNGERLTLAHLAGNVVVLMFFSPTCPHCHTALEFVQRLSKELGRDDLRVVAVSVQNRKYVIDDMRTRLGLALTIYVDPKDEIFKTYAHPGTVPDTLILDRESRVIARHTGMAPRLEALMTMQIRQALGVENPILLDAKGYSGAEFCAVCHSAQHDTWSLTNHAYAFNTLAEHGSARDAECVGCHTAGFGSDGGYDLEARPRHLEGVQCENCHGRGGPHQSPKFASKGFEAACADCHTPDHSLRFVFGERLPMVSHAANARFANLDVAERRALLERRDKRERQLFDRGDFVGSQACAECHQSEHVLWTKSAHASAFATLREKSQHENTDCQRCHTTGYDQDGGFPHGGDALLGVGCESCHGPGGNHVADGARREGSILALTDKCDSCVVMQICGSCHDEANDPGFEFELFDKIDAIRHGFRDRGAAAE